jgi:hypothetical protein
VNHISNSIYHYYLDHFDKLPLDKQFHFASRLYVWRQDNECAGRLQQLKPHLLPDGDAYTTLTSIAEGKLIPLLPGNQNVLQLRQPYNEHYPMLRSAARILYWATMLDQTYNANAKEAIHSILPGHDMQVMYRALTTDDAAVAMLSTHAVNFLYLYSKYYLQEKAPSPARFIDIASKPNLYDLSNPLHVQLCMYLLTHTIIAESMFYAEPLSVPQIPAYNRILSTLENILAPHLDTISLDNKLEFLVCCRLANYTTRLEDDIVGEAGRSMSPSGTFLVDTHNSSGSSYTLLEKSEHRNTLYIMATGERGAI